jgi:hypothetical protein
MGELDHPQSRKSIEEERIAQNALCDLKQYYIKWI